MVSHFPLKIHRAANLCAPASHDQRDKGSIVLLCFDVVIEVVKLVTYFSEVLTEIF